MPAACARLIGALKESGARVSLFMDPDPAHDRDRRDDRRRPDRALHRALCPGLCGRRGGAPAAALRAGGRGGGEAPVSASTPGTTSTSTTCRPSARRCRSWPRSASATRSRPMRCGSAFRPRSRPICARSGGSRSRRDALRLRAPTLRAAARAQQGERHGSGRAAGKDLHRRRARRDAGARPAQLHPAARDPAAGPRTRCWPAWSRR